MLHPSSRARAIAPLIVSTLLFALLAPRPCEAAEERAWRLLDESPAFPPALGVPVGVYDPVRQRVLVIDANLASSANQVLKVHVFEPLPVPRWSELATGGTNPGERYLAALVHDPVRDRLLVIGKGRESEFEVWALPLSGDPTWQKLVIQGGPPSARWGHSATYDPVHDRVILFGGMTAGPSPQVFLSDAWALSLSSNTWTLLIPDGAGPAGREGHGTMYDPVGQRMIVFGGHFEAAARGFWNDLWELSLGDSVAWHQLQPTGPIPSARSAFGTTYDPVRKRMLVHGGILADSGLEPDEMWALSLDGASAWRRVSAENSLRGRSYPIDVYDPIADALLACGGGGYPQTSVLSLASPTSWSALLPADPLPSPGSRSRHAVVRDTRRNRYVVVGGDFSSADSTVWNFDLEGTSHWKSVRAPVAPFVGQEYEYSRASVYDSLGDRIILFEGTQVWSTDAEASRNWTQLGPTTWNFPQRTLGLGAGVALDTRRNRLIVTGGLIQYPHSGDYTVSGVWELSLGSAPAWQHLGDLPHEYGSTGHATYYDPIRDRLVVLGGAARPGRLRLYPFGATVWTTPLDSTLDWTSHNSTVEDLPHAPPYAQSTYDPRSNRLFIASDTRVWSRGVDDTGEWTELEVSANRPTVTSAIAYDPSQDQLLALYASSPPSNHVEAWALAVGPLDVTLVGARRDGSTAQLDWRSITAYGRESIVERRAEGTDWITLGPIEFDVRGLGRFADNSVLPGNDYAYRVSVPTAAATFHSAAVLVADPANLRLTLLGAEPNPAMGEFRLAFSLPAAGAARLELFDVHGRRCLSREVGAMGPGLHSILIPRLASLRPGIYLARLQWAGESRITRVVLM